MRVRRVEDPSEPTWLLIGWQLLLIVAFLLGAFGFAVHRSGVPADPFFSIAVDDYYFTAKITLLAALAFKLSSIWNQSKPPSLVTIDKSNNQITTPDGSYSTGDLEAVLLLTDRYSGPKRVAGQSGGDYYVIELECSMRLIWNSDAQPVSDSGEAQEEDMSIDGLKRQIEPKGDQSVRQILDGDIRKLSAENQPEFSKHTTIESLPYRRAWRICAAIGACTGVPFMDTVSQPPVMHPNTGMTPKDFPTVAPDANNRAGDGSFSIDKTTPHKTVIDDSRSFTILAIVLFIFSLLPLGLASTTSGFFADGVPYWGSITLGTSGIFLALVMFFVPRKIVVGSDFISYPFIPVLPIRRTTYREDVRSVHGFYHRTQHQRKFRHSPVVERPASGIQIVTERGWFELSSKTKEQAKAQFHLLRRVLRDRWGWPKIDKNSSPRNR